ncbi:MAG: hypothetical protein RLP44_30725 [Aggregatilineales bacterium]
MFWSSNFLSVDEYGDIGRILANTSGKLARSGDALMPIFSGMRVGTWWGELPPQRLDYRVGLGI